MDFKQLRYFIAVAEELHFGRAATRLFISQPALSFDIKKLESQLGVQLLIRDNKSVKLTSAGQVLLDESRKLLVQAEQMKRLTLRSAAGTMGRLRVGFVNSMLYQGLPGAITRFEQAHPDMEVVVMEMNTSEQAQALQRGQIDIGFVHWGKLPEGIVSERLIADPFLCCLAPDHRLAKQSSIDLTDLANDDFILFPRSVSPHYHDLIIARCVDAGFSPYIRHEARLWQTIMAMVGLGMGVALLPQTLCLAWQTQVRYLQIEQPGALSEIHAILPADNPLRAAEIFLAFIKEGLSSVDSAE